MNTSDDQLTAKCFSAIKDFVNAIRPTRYATDGLPSIELFEAESALNQCWSEFETLSERGWEVIRHQVSRIDEMYLWHYAVRMAEMAVRRNEENLIRSGLMALIVDDKFGDRRDLFTALALLLDAAKRIKADADSIFRDVAKLGSSQRRETIEKYIDQRGEESSMEQVLKGLGYCASGSKESFTYRSTY